MTEQGITILNDVTLNSVSNDGNKPVITADGQNYTFDAVLYATGRRPNTTNIGLETLKDRKNIPYTTFLTPPLARVGLTEEDAINKGYTVKTKEMLVATMPRAHVNDNLKGAFKIVVDAESNLILGATLYSQSAEELINMIKVAMDNNIPYTYFKNQIFTHPTMAENLNDLCNF